MCGEGRAMDHIHTGLNPNCKLVSRRTALTTHAVRDLAVWRASGMLVYRLPRAMEAVSHGCLHRQLPHDPACGTGAMRATAAPSHISHDPCGARRGRFTGERQAGVQVPAHLVTDCTRLKAHCC